MHSEFAAVFEQDGDLVIAFCLKIPGANGQGRTKDEAQENSRSEVKRSVPERPRDL